MDNIRELKFRAWWVEEKEMDECTKIDLPNKAHNEEVIAMQYAGKNDKNNVEIYEGDIVKWSNCDHWWIAVIEPLDSCPSGPLYAVERLHNCTIDEDEMYTYQVSDSRKGARKDIPFMGRETEVIGNIYENPELIELKQ
jgi:uncharacterized phage protein (TIGR01671 family)